MPATKKRILIVDDERFNIDILMDLLKSEYRILVAKSGPQALSITEKHVVDLILLDIMMPGMDGYEVCRKLKEDPQRQDIPVIFVTAKTEDEDEARGFALGAVDYITKPISFPIAKARIRTHLQLTQAYKDLAQQNAVLEETALLRENVERIARHDLKAPLSGVINFPSLIMMKHDLDAGTRKMLHLIEESGYQMLNIINRSLDLYKMETGIYQYQPDNVELLNILDKIRREMEMLSTAKEITISIFLDNRSLQQEDHFLAEGEDLLCYSLLANLVKNALEASPENTTVAIYLSREKNNVLIEIKNQGAVPTEIRANFFEKYATAGKMDGTGLGTYSARLITETQGGSINLATSEETGTVISVRLKKATGSG